MRQKVLKSVVVFLSDYTNGIMMRKSTRLISALDVTDERRALKIAKEVGGLADAFKINYPLALSCGLQIVGKLSKYGDVICDFKVADIPSTNALIVDQVFKSGAKGVIAHGFVGEDSVRACVQAAKGDVFVVTEMSHPGGEKFTAIHAEEIAKLAVEVGATGIIAPATRPERISALRKIVGSLLILSPGVGVQGGSAALAISAGADYIIVGRSIYESENPRQAAKAIAEEVKHSLPTTY